MKIPILWKTTIFSGCKYFRSKTIYIVLKIIYFLVFMFLMEFFLWFWALVWKILLISPRKCIPWLIIYLFHIISCMWYSVWYEQKINFLENGNLQRPNLRLFWNRHSFNPTYHGLQLYLLIMGGGGFHPPL